MKGIDCATARDQLARLLATPEGRDSVVHGVILATAVLLAEREAEAAGRKVREAKQEYERFLNADPNLEELIGHAMLDATQCRFGA
jgi:hypothetical protein